ncbi:MAG: hypothetical protein RIS92_938 [Verrucomicrobiota bacterium]
MGRRGNARLRWGSGADVSVLRRVRKAQREAKKRVVWGLGGGCGCDFPALAIGFGDEAVGLGKVGDSQGGGVPFQRFLGEAGCDVSERNGFAEGAGVMEAVAGLFAAHGGIDPDVPVAELGFLGERAGRELLGGVEFWHADVGEDEGAFFSDEEGAGGGKVITGRHFCEFLGGFQAAVVPGDGEGAGCEWVCGEEEPHCFERGPDMFVDARVFGRDGGGGIEVEGGEDGVEDVASEVAEGAGTEVLPIAPDEGMVDGFVIAQGGDADPEVPVEVSGDGEGFGGGGEELVTFVSGDAGPGVDFFDFADEAFADESGAEAVFEVGMDLVPHLGDDAG